MGSGAAQADHRWGSADHRGVTATEAKMAMVHRKPRVTGGSQGMYHRGSQGMFRRSITGGSQGIYHRDDSYISRRLHTRRATKVSMPPMPHKGSGTKLWCGMPSHRDPGGRAGT